MKTPEQMAEDYANDWHKDCDYPAEILRHTKKATETVFLAGYKAGQEHPFQFQTKMWVDPIGPQDRWISVKELLPEIEQYVVIYDHGQFSVNYLTAWGHWAIKQQDVLPHPTHWMPLPEPPRK